MQNTIPKKTRRIDKDFKYFAKSRPQNSITSVGLWRDLHTLEPMSSTRSSSLVEEDVQPDLPKSQTCMECCRAHGAYFFGIVINTTAYHLGQNILRLILQKSSMH